MINIHKRFIVDEKGNPKDVIIPLEDFREIEELLGLDLDDKTIANLRQAQIDREIANEDAYLSLDSI